MLEPQRLVTAVILPTITNQQTLITKHWDYLLLALIVTPQFQDGSQQNSLYITIILLSPELMERLPMIVLHATKVFIQIPQIPVTDAIPPIIIKLQTRHIRRQDSQPTVHLVIQSLHGLHQHSITMHRISQYIVENIRVDGHFVLNVILQLQILHYLAALNAMNTVIKQKLTDIITE